MDDSTFDWNDPTMEQLRAMSIVRNQFAETAAVLAERLPDGPDKTYVLRKLRECAMWSMVCITRNTDGSPRQE